MISTDDFLGLSYELQEKELEGLAIEELEGLATELYKKEVFPKWGYLFGPLELVLSERRRRLDAGFEWTAEAKERLLLVSEKFFAAFDSGYAEAMSIADSLEKRIAGGGFLRDYEIDIEMTPYLRSSTADPCRPSFEYVLTEPLSSVWFSVFHFHCVGHDSYSDEREMPLYFDRSFDWNSEYFNGAFDGKIINYGIHELLDTVAWSFQDILDIDDLFIDVHVRHQSEIEF